MVPKVPDGPKVPGLRALSFASRWFDPAIVHRTFEPLIADWQREWSDEGPSRRWQVSLRGSAAFVAAVVLSSPKIASTGSPAAVTNRIAVRITRFTAIGTALLLIPVATQVEPWARGAMVLFLIPSALVLAFPFAMVGAVDALRRTAPLPPHVERATVTKLGLMATVFALIVAGWVGPAANQTWRVAMSQAHAQPGANPVNVPLRGVRELSTYELIAHQSRAVAFEPYTGGADLPSRAQAELSNRIALALLPIVLLWLRWRGIEHARDRRTSALPAPLVAVMAIVVFGVGFVSGWRLELEWGLARGSGAWLPIAMFSVWVLSRKLRRRLPTLDHTLERARANWHASRCP